MLKKDVTSKLYLALPVCFDCVKRWLEQLRICAARRERVAYLAVCQIMPNLIRKAADSLLIFVDSHPNLLTLTISKQLILFLKNFFFFK